MFDLENLRESLGQKRYVPFLLHFKKSESRLSDALVNIFSSSGSWNEVGNVGNVL